MAILLGNTDFKEIAEVRADSKNRISLGRSLGQGMKRYRMYEDPLTGNILLEPLAAVPLSEPWLEKAPKARASVERGLEQAKAGQLIQVEEDFSKYIEDCEE